MSWRPNEWPTNFDGLATICTPSGILHDLRDPASAIIEDCDVRDVGAIQCRWNGALRAPNLRHWAWMTLRSAELYGPGDITEYVACHDLHEVVVLDVPGPMKTVLGSAYADFEEEWAEAFHARYGLAWPVAPEIARIVHDLDMRARVVEIDMLAPAGHPLRTLVGQRLAEGTPATEEERRVYAFAQSLGATPLWSLVRRGLDGRVP